jgi:ribonucleotide monophosphatase NagD (HAD superfamily)
MKAAIAFDVSGVLIKSGKPLPRAKLALGLLK